MNYLPRSETEYDIAVSPPGIAAYGVRIETMTPRPARQENPVSACPVVRVVGCPTSEIDARIIVNENRYYLHLDNNVKPHSQRRKPGNG